MNVFLKFFLVGTMSEDPN